MLAVGSPVPGNYCVCQPFSHPLWPGRNGLIGDRALWAWSVSVLTRQIVTGFGPGFLDVVGCSIDVAPGTD